VEVKQFPFTSFMMHVCKPLSMLGTSLKSSRVLPYRCLSLSPSVHATSQQPAKVVYRMLTPALTGRVVDAISESFANSTDDPFTNKLNLTKKDWRDMCGMFVERAALADKSIVAIDTETQNVEGCIINEDWKESVPEEYRQLPAAWDPVRAIFHELRTRYKSRRRQRIETGQVFHPLYFTCVTPFARRKGIAHGLWMASVDIGRSYNYQYMVCETSSKVSEKVCESLGFQMKASVAFNDWMFEGENIFAELPKVNDNFQRLSIWERPIPSDLY